MDKKVEEAPKKRMLPRKNLVVSKTGKANSINAYYSDTVSGQPSKSPSSTDCMGSCFSRIHSQKQGNHNLNVRLFVHTMHGLTKKDIEHWVMFINRCGFKCTFEEVDGVVGSIVFNGKDYLNYCHQKLGITAARYICMHYNTGYNEIANLATTLYEKFEELDAYQAFILAHYGQSAGSYFDAGHAVVYFNNGCPKLITKEKMLERIKANPTSSINNACTEYTGKLSVQSAINQAKKGDWEGLIKQLI